MARTTVETQLAKLRKQREALEAKEKALLSKANDKVMGQIVALVKKHQITLEELTAALGKSKTPRKTAAAPRAAKKTSDKRSVVPPKYRNPDNAAQTWTGRGKAPLWVQALKEAGRFDAALIAAQ